MAQISVFKGDLPDSISFKDDFANQTAIIIQRLFKE